jgi:acetyl esterase/lipase
MSAILRLALAGLLSLAVPLATTANAAEPELREHLARPANNMHAPPGMSPEIAAKLREIGPKIDGANTTPLYAPLHAALKHDGVDVRREQVYGPHERHRADVFVASQASGTRPVIVFVHGGGFARGAKSTPGQFYYDNIGYWAAEHGLVGVTINYRLSPEFQYPSGAEDVGRVVQWLRHNAAQFAGDANRIFLFGNSAGGAHVADYLARTAQPQVAGAILLSGVYTASTTWTSYYGEDQARWPSMSPLPQLAKLRLPLLVANAELDPPDFHPDTNNLIAGRKAAGTPTTVVQLPNHSHISETYAIGTADESMTAPILQFIQAPPR